MDFSNVPNNDANAEQLAAVKRSTPRPEDPKGDAAPGEEGPMANPLPEALSQTQPFETKGEADTKAAYAELTGNSDSVATGPSDTTNPLESDSTSKASEKSGTGKTGETSATTSDSSTTKPTASPAPAPADDAKHHGAGSDKKVPASGKH